MSRADLDTAEPSGQRAGRIVSTVRGAGERQGSVWQS